MLHPETRALLALIAERNVPAMHTLSPAEARRQYRERRSFTQPPPAEVGAVETFTIAGPAGPLHLRGYWPSDGARPLPVLVYFHGGGFVIGDLDTHDVLCRALCTASGAAVIAVDYRLAPEHPFPAAIDDCLAATRWVFAHAAERGFDRARIAVGGDSAGGNLAAAVCLLLREAKAALPCFQLLIYPATDALRQTQSFHDNGKGYLLEAATMAYFENHYLPHAEHKSDWRASPLRAPYFGGLPAALIVTAGFDPLRDEGLAYAMQLSEAGVACSYLCYSRQIHGFITMAGVLGEANSAVHTCAAALRAAFAR